MVVVSTSDQSPLLRIRAALAATAVAEYFCGRGKNVLLVVDSLTRLAMAQREISLAAGEPPTAKGYTPSVFTLLARLIERAGKFSGGSITAFYTVLMEGDDQQDPLVDGGAGAARWAYHARPAAGHPQSLSADRYPRQHQPADAHGLRAAAPRESEWAAPAAGGLPRSEDLIRIGAYQKGNDPILDQALAVMPDLNRFLEQTPQEAAPLADNTARLLALPG